ncbi:MULTISPECIES: TetR/AcrR family transcriptional regulator [unclassified Streptomyces]|uniref:TetR/AcrR family transcriptional regulator n=1 Tax=unclassified Streptomyces TaxID=2593676 RepID=UPI00381B328B
MSRPEFERARSPQAKKAREAAILDAAVRLARARGVRDVTLTDIATEVGMHKSAMLRYFETREEIFLRLSAAAWVEWSGAVRAELAALRPEPAADADAAVEVPVDSTARGVAVLLADSLVARPLFCDLLAHTPLNLERNVSFEAVRSFKLSTIAEVTAIGAALGAVLALDGDRATSVVATATAMAGALWQMAAPGTRLRAFYEAEPDLAHAVVDVAPRLADILTALLTGYGATASGADGG